MENGQTTQARLGEDSLELILALKIPGETIGGTFHGLALEIARSEDPQYRHEPPYPRLPFRSREELDEAVSFGFELYREARDLILKEDWGCS